MRGYDVYFTGGDGHIVNRIIVLATNDKDALGHAKHLVDGHAVELWQEGRHIATFEPEE